VIRVVLVDDHEVVRAGIGHLLSTVDGIEVVGSASDGDEALGVVADTRPDVVLMDLSMPRVDGIEAIERIAATHPETSTVALTSFSDRERILAALDAGAVGYLLKDAQPAELVAGVRAAAAGQSPLAPKAATEVIRARGRAPAREECLTDRERDVLRLVAEGLPTKQIAHRLGISSKTVKAHLTNVFRQIGVTDRLQAALWAREHGVVDDSHTAS
jgi:DNA-binding NarL/FixJ family response regulator